MYVYYFIEIVKFIWKSYRRYFKYLKVIFVFGINWFLIVNVICKDMEYIRFKDIYMYYFYIVYENIYE